MALEKVFFFLAFALGYVLYDLCGYKPENDDAPIWVDLVCTIPILAARAIGVGCSRWVSVRSPGLG